MSQKIFSEIKRLINDPKEAKEKRKSRVETLSEREKEKWLTVIVDRAPNRKERLTI